MGGGEWGQKLVFAIKSPVLDIEMIPSGAAGEEHKLALWAQLMRIVPGCSPKFPVACVWGGVRKARREMRDVEQDDEDYLSVYENAIEDDRAARSDIVFH